MSDKIEDPNRGPNRREALAATVGLAVAAGLSNVSPKLFADSAGKPHRSRHFIFAGDTLGFNTGPSPVFSKIATSIATADPSPLFVLIAGDHVWDAPGKPAEMTSRWHEWHKAASPLGELEVLHLTGNHTVYDEESAALYRAQFPDLPKNGPANGVGLSWWKRWDDVLLVGVNTAFNPLGKVCRVEHEWLDGVLRENRDARWKLVAGHHPVHPVNGFEHYNWRIWQADGRAFWSVLVQHRVDAYLCAHVIAFDAQVHDGIPQLCSAGGGFPMKWGNAEYDHYARVQLLAHGLCCESIDPDGQVRERVSWPPSLPPVNKWSDIGVAGASLPKTSKSADGKTVLAPSVALRFSGQFKPTADGDQCLLSGSNGFGNNNDLWIGLRGNKFVVEFGIASGEGRMVWYGPSFAPGPIDIQVLLHRDLGPGGILFRHDDSAGWSSMRHSSCRGMESLRWPDAWSVGHDYATLLIGDCPDRLDAFNGTEALRVTFATPTNETL